MKFTISESCIFHLFSSDLHTFGAHLTSFLVHVQHAKQLTPITKFWQKHRHESKEELVYLRLVCVCVFSRYKAVQVVPKRKCIFHYCKNTRGVRGSWSGCVLRVRRRGLRYWGPAWLAMWGDRSNILICFLFGLQCNFCFEFFYATRFFYDLGLSEFKEMFLLRTAVVYLEISSHPIKTLYATTLAAALKAFSKCA